MEMHEHIDHLDLAAMERKYMEELVPMLENIQGQPAFSCSLTNSEKAQLVRFAADMCLVKAAGANARWGKALRETLINITDIACVDHHHCHTVSTPIISTEVGMTKTPHLDIYARVGTELGAKKTSRFANRTYYKYRGARTHGRSRSRQQYTTSDKYRGARTHGDSRQQHAKRQRAYDRYRGVYTHGNDMLRQAMKGTVSYSARIRKTYAKPVTIAAALVSSKEENPHSMLTMASQIEDLQQLIPGGKALIDPVSLLEETALYILALQMQVHSLHTLANAPPLPS